MSTVKLHSNEAKGKTAAIAALFAISGAVILSGLLMSIYSIANNVNFTIFGGQINGAVFGAVAIFLGVRYLLSVRRLNKNIGAAGIHFSWANFKK